MKQSRKGMLIAALICGTIVPVLFGGTSAYAAEAEEDAALQAFELNPMVITAQRTELSDLDTPAGTSVITAADIERSGAKTAYEIIERQVGVTNNAYGTGGREFGGSSSRIVLRGMDKGTLVLVNGAPLNLMNYNSTEGIPTEAIEKIEIVRGAQAALYGAEAVGGVVNIITKKGGPSKTTISYGAGNYDQKWSVTSSGKNYMAYIGRDYYGDVKQTNRVFGKGSTRIWKLRDSTKTNAFVSVSPIDKFSIQYAHTEGKYYRDDWTRDGATGELTGKRLPYFYDDKRDNVSLLYDDKDAMFKTILSYNKRRVEPKRGTADFKYTDMEWYHSSNWDLDNLTWDIQKGWNLRGDKDTFIVGLNLQKDDVKVYKADKSYDDADRKTAAIYASYKYQFSPKFSTTLGMRALHVSDYAENQNAFLPQIQTLYKINDNTSWYINVGKSFEMPAINQYFNEDRIGGVTPQEGWTYETGVKVVNKSNSWKFDVFHMDIDGKFDWKENEETGIKYLTNVGKWKNTGAELEYTQNVNDNLKMRFGLMYADPKKKEADDEPYVQDEARLQLTAGIDYQIGKFTANLNYLFVGKRQDSYYNMQGYSGSASNIKKGLWTGPDHSVPNRSLLNAAFTYKPDKHNTLQLTLNNILDRDDTINKYENWTLPFNWMMTYSYSF